ncbi:hypothetical protein CIRG_00368 [Coccidioides immitis RMSCC 2394]|uniref:Uncharacterized protein n=1 Tax=Coccidioides immitis RMSCC 2394 TaxID=404692 RepID=A0A0J6XVL8_COCIT|nr:hypothetical protein CIRG_00368 [Coccidioides immitis RMSCC 2394]
MCFLYQARTKHGDEGQPSQPSVPPPLPPHISFLGNRESCVRSRRHMAPLSYWISRNGILARSCSSQALWSRKRRSTDTSGGGGRRIHQETNSIGYDDRHNPSPVGGETEQTRPFAPGTFKAFDDSQFR